MGCTIVAKIIITMILKSQLSNCCLKTLQTKTDQQVSPSFFYSTGEITSYGVVASVSINDIVLYRMMMCEVFNSSAPCWSRASSCPQQTGSRSITHIHPGKSQQDPGFHKIHVCCGSRSGIHTLAFTL